MMDVCLRVAEFNLRANYHFKQSICNFEEKNIKKLQIEREHITSYVSKKYPNLKISKFLREIKKYDEKNIPIQDMPNDFNLLMRLLCDEEKNIVEKKKII